MATIYNKKNQYMPYWTYIFLGICFAYYGYMVIQYGGTTRVDNLIEAGAKFSPQIVLFNQWWRLITAAFIHIGFTHILFNSLSIYFIGAEVEYIVGHGRYFLIYMASAVGGNLFSFAFNAEVVSAGASTAIFGLYACYLALAYMNPDSHLLGRRASTFSILLLISFINSFSSIGVDNWGHFGGLLYGLLTTLMIGRASKGNITIGVRVVSGIFLAVLSIALVYLGMFNVERLLRGGI